MIRVTICSFKNTQIFGCARFFDLIYNAMKDYLERFKIQCITFENEEAETFPPANKFNGIHFEE